MAAYVVVTPEASDKVSLAIVAFLRLQLPTNLSNGAGVCVTESLTAVDKVVLEAGAPSLVGVVMVLLYWVNTKRRGLGGKCGRRGGPLQDQEPPRGYVLAASASDSTQLDSLVAIPDQGVEEGTAAASGTSGGRGTSGASNYGSFESPTGGGAPAADVDCVPASSPVQARIVSAAVNFGLTV
jgi:hypothetical protein